MFVSCPAARFHATSRTVCICVYAYMTRYVCGSAGTSRQRGTSTHYMHAAARHFHALCACGSAGTFTHCMYAAAWALSRTMCMRQRGTFTHYMHAAARALSLFHSQGSAAAPGHVGDDGLPDCTRVRVCSSLFEFVGVCVRVCVELGGPCPAQPRQSCQPLCQPQRQPLCQSLCRFLSTACAHTPTREVALVALVFLSVHLSLVARWRRVGEVVTICRVRAMARWWPCPRGPSPCSRRVSLGGASGALGVARGAAWRVAWRVQALCAVGLKRGAGLTLQMKTRVDARLLVAPRGATCWYGSTHASYGVPFSSTN
jgi:hypothetical protein